MHRPDDELQFARSRMIHFFDHVQMSNLRVVENFGDIIKRHCRNIVCFQNFEPLVPALGSQTSAPIPAPALRSFRAGDRGCLNALILSDVHAVRGLQQCQPKFFRHRTVDRQRPHILQKNAKAWAFFTRAMRLGTLPVRR